MISTAQLRVFLPLTIFLFSMSLRARAESARLSWDVPPSCPSQARFVEEVAARTPNAQFSAEGLRLFRTTITHDGKVFRGHLQIFQGNEEQGARDIDSSQCPELVSALALLTALAIDPNASSAALPARLPIAVAPSPSALPAVQPVEPSKTPAQPSSVPPAQPVASVAALPWHLSVQPGLILDFGVAPTVLPGFDLLGELWQESTALSSHDYQAAFSYSAATSDNLRLRLYRFRANACPVRSSIPSGLFLQACAGFQAGLVHSEAVDISSRRESDNSWFAASLGPRVGYQSGIFSSGLFLGALVPFARYRFYTENPWHELYQMPQVGLSININAGLRFF